MTGTVILNSQLVNELASILAGVLHSRHAGRLLRGSIVEEPEPQVRGEVELVKGGVARVLVRDLLVIKFAILQGSHETIARNQLNLADLIGDSGNEFVVVNDDSVGIRSLLDNLLRNTHASRVVHGVSGVSDRVLD